MKKKPLNRPFAGLKRRLAQQQHAEEKAAARQRAVTQQASLQDRERPAPASQPADSADDSFATLAARSSRDAIKPLEPLSRRRITPPRQQPAQPPMLGPSAPHSASYDYDLVTRDGFIEGRRCDIDPAELATLRRAPPGFVVDLHGLVAEDARRRLHRVIIGRYRQGERHLLVVVGKGLHSQSGQGVLREHVPLWLTETSVAGYVRAFVSARREDGGHGALYVRIRP